MAQQLIGIGAVPDDGTGDPLRIAFTKTNDNFTDVYAQAAANTLNKVDLAGDTMTGPLVLSADPANAMEAATKQYVDAGLAAQDNTDEITEGTTNLYYTDTRARASVSVTDNGGDGSLTYNNTAGVIEYTGPSAAEVRAHFNVSDLGGDGALTYDPNTGVIEYTGPSATDVRAHFSGSGDITYDVNTGDFSATTYKSTDFDTDLASKTTDDLTEGTNLYYTTARVDSDFDTRLATKTTDDLTEGTNLYYTDARVSTYLTTNTYATENYVDTEIASLIDTAPATLDTLNELAAALGDDPNFATTVANDIGLKLNTADFTSTADTWLATKDTDDLTEGSLALFYTDERVDDRVATLIQAGTNVDVTYNDPAGTLTINLDVTGGIDLSNNDTDDLAEGTTNLYYTTARANTDFDTRLATKTTDDVAEGTNEYYTDAKVDARIAAANAINENYVMFGQTAVQTNGNLVEGEPLEYVNESDLTISLTLNDGASSILVTFDGSFYNDDNSAHWSSATLQRQINSGSWVAVSRMVVPPTNLVGAPVPRQFTFIDSNHGAATGNTVTYRFINTTNADGFGSGSESMRQTYGLTGDTFGVREV